MYGYLGWTPVHWRTCEGHRVGRVVDHDPSNHANGAMATTTWRERGARSTADLYRLPDEDSFS
jgi:hypothetical protein